MYIYFCCFSFISVASHKTKPLSKLDIRNSLLAWLEVYMLSSSNFIHEGKKKKNLHLMNAIY